MLRLSFSHAVFLLRSSLLLVLFLLVSTALAQINISASYSGETVTFVGDHNVRYLVDYASQTLVLPGAKLTDTQTKFPAGYKVFLEEDKIIVEVGQPFRVSLSSNERVLTLVRGETLGALPEQIAGDARAPVMYRPRWPRICGAYTIYRLRWTRGSAPCW